MNAVIYARYSSSNQREESIAGQLRDCHAYADRNNLTVINEYTDSALTGKTDKRPGFQKMIKDAENGQFEIVIVWKLDRFARNRYDSAMYRNKLKKCGVKLVSAMENISDSPEGIILEGLMESLAEYYSANLSENVKRGLYDSALERKMLNNNVFGYRPGPDGKYEIDPETAPIVRRIFNEYASGKPYPDIIADLNADGLRSKWGEFKNNSIRKLLKNEKYVGVYRYKDIYDPEGIPPIIDRDLFDRVQDELKRRSISRKKSKTKTGANYLLTGKLFCGHCLSPMTGESARSKTGKIYYWYSCSNNKNKVKTCNKRRVPKDWIESEILRILHDEILTDDFIRYVADAAVTYEERFDQNPEIEQFETELKQVDNKIRNVANAIASGVVTETLPAMLADFEKQREQILTKLAQLKTGKQHFTREAVTEYMYKLKSISRKDSRAQQKLIDACLRSVYVFDTDDPDELRIVLNLNYFDSDEEIQHDEIVRIVNANPSLKIHTRTIIRNRFVLLVRTIKKGAG